MGTKTALAAPKYTVPAVTKAMELLRLLGEADVETTTKALALRLGIPRTSCYRILGSLIAQDWVRPTEGGRHELSLGLVPLLAHLRPVATLAAAVEPALRQLAERTQLTAKISVRQGDFAVTVARVESPRQTAVAVRLGAAFHLAYGSSGTVLLSRLPRGEVDRILKNAPANCWEHQRQEDVQKRLMALRETGWCSDMGAYSPSCHAISAPVANARQDVLAAMTVIGFPHELPSDRASELAGHLLDAIQVAEKSLQKIAMKD